MAVLLAPVVFAAKAYDPSAVPLPLVLAPIAALPIATLESAVATPSS